MTDTIKLKNKKSKDSKCAGCGGTLVFSPELQKLECGHCGSVVDFITEEKVIKKDFEQMNREFKSWDKESILVKCTNCGAKEVVSDKSIAHMCSFCNSSKITSADELPGIKPNGVLPFLVGEAQATKGFMKWLRKKWFTPNDLKKTATINKFNGVYTPTWSYDTDADTSYKGTLYRKETRRRGDRTETVTVHIPVKGSRQDIFRDLLVPVGQKIDRLSFKRLEPFRYDNLRVYNTNYLAGFAANHYIVNSGDAWKSAMQVMKSTITGEIIRKHNAHGVTRLNMDTNYNDKKYSYILLPIWVCNFKYKQKLFNFFINGNTGKVTGKVPRSAFKITMFILSIVALFILFAVLSGAAGIGMANGFN
jgi:ribosomal protein S27E